MKDYLITSGTSLALDTVPGVEQTALFKPQAEPEFNIKLLEWAKRQPSSPLGFIDVAAGWGVEAQTLALNGFYCIAQDADPKTVDISLHSDSRLGSAEKLNYPDNSFSGILNKSVWIFLSPEQRASFLKEAQRTLVNGGSVLIQSEKSDIHRARYLPKTSDIAQCLPSFDFKKYGDRCDEEWRLEIERLRGYGHEIFQIEYSCLVSDIVDLASQSGLKMVDLIEYGYNHPLSLQNRCVKQSGFVIALQKI